MKAEEVGQRLDIFCSAYSPDKSRSRLQKAIKEGEIVVNGDVVKPSYAVREGDLVLVAASDVAVVEPGEEEEVPDIQIVHEDKDLVVIDKPAGVLVHPTGADSLNSLNTVAGWFKQRYPEAAEVGEDSARPGIVHRLDKNTSGLMVLAKTDSSFESLKKQFKKLGAKKEYLALVYGVPGMGEGRINQAISRSKKNPSRRTIVPKEKDFLMKGKPAITEWKKECSFGDKFALLRVFPLTGRTHQIRVHMHFIGHPMVGDELYVFKRQKPPVGAGRQLLHAEKLTLILGSGKKKTFVASLPDDFRLVLDNLEGKKVDENEKKLGYRTPSSFKAKGY